MATYTYTTPVDEDAALARELPRVNGQLVAQGQPPVDLQGLWTIMIFQRLQPLVSLTLSEQVSPVIQKFIQTDLAGRAQIIAAVSAVPVKGT